MGLFYSVGAALFVYAVLFYLANSVMREKLGVSSGLLANGIVSIIVGFLGSQLLTLKLIDGVYWEYELIYAFLSILSLLLGIGGIIMVIVALLRE
jgi:hypothetical protein